MSCLCFVSVSIPLHLKCPALPLRLLPSVNSSHISFFPPTLQLEMLLSKACSLVSATISRPKEHEDSCFFRRICHLFKILPSLNLKVTFPNFCIFTNSLTLLNFFSVDFFPFHLLIYFLFSLTCFDICLVSSAKHWNAELPCI